MKKYFLALIMVLCLTSLMGCGSPAIMPPIECNKPIEFQSSRNAVLYWDMGKENVSIVSSKNDNNLVGSIFESIDRSNNPSRYTLKYGKAEQAIFITSFKNILEKQAVFKNVEIITDPKEAKPQDVLITINFKSTRVSSPELGYQISLSVDMAVSGGGKPAFTRNFFVKNDDAFESFQIRQNKVSTKLAENLINGLKKWHEQTKT